MRHPLPVSPPSTFARTVLTHAAAWAALSGLLLASPAASAVTVVSVTPQGEVAAARQVVVKFSEAVVTLGDPRLADPASVQCEGLKPDQQKQGNGGWSNTQVWTYHFGITLPPGTRCTVDLKPDWKPLQGSLTGKTRYEFNTGGPGVQSIQPAASSTELIEEEQHFVLELTGPVVESSLAGKVWCETEGLGDRIPVQLVTGDVRRALLKEVRGGRGDADRSADLVLKCARPLPVGASVRLVWGKGIAAQANPKIVTQVEQRFNYKVRPPLTAEFSCSRERAGAPCWPLEPMTLTFSAPVPRALADKVRLKPVDAKGGAPEVAPVFGRETGDIREFSFPKPFPPHTQYRLELPSGLTDDAGRPLANAASFPLSVQTGDAPPIAKFATSPFGILELNADAMLPVTLRHVQGDMRPGAPTGKVRVLRLDSDADILQWYAKLRDWNDDWERRGESLLKPVSGVRAVDLPQLQGGDPRPFEVVGIPLPQPGYQVVEIESLRLGESLLDKKAPMFVRTGALVTNLGVHFKQGRENSQVWVTTLDRAKPVEGAEVRVNDCTGRQLWSGRTDAQGLASTGQAFAVPDVRCKAHSGLFITARKADDKGVVDTSFMFSSWQKGIESWRFGVPTDRSDAPTVRAHTVLDRSLFRAGETVSMKHFVRTEVASGLGPLKAQDLPTRVKIIHVGSNQEFVQPIAWRGTRYAESSWNIPPAAKLGTYQLVLERDGGEPTRRALVTGEFRVEEFRIPLLDARISGPKEAVIAPRQLPLGVQLNYLAGGPVAKAPLRVSSLLRGNYVEFNGYQDFSFGPPQLNGSGGEGDEAPEGPAEESQLVADKLPATTDKNGAAAITIDNLPKVTRPSQLITEVTFNDPNGEVQTVSNRTLVWPSAVVLGIKAGAWNSAQGRVKFQAVALDPQGKPVKGQRIEVRGSWAQYTSTRKRMVGGFYAYESHSSDEDIGNLCSGTTDERGLLLCEARLDKPGHTQLIAQSVDSAGNKAVAATGVWVTRQGELWFAQDNDDRIDVIPEKRAYQPGETARLQVRMPFREATALVSVEREGIIESRIVTLRGSDPTVELTVQKSWGPNVYVSVLALRGRVRDVPWYSFFTWGWKEPVNWARSFWYEGSEYQAPTAMVDLSKPAHKLGVATFDVGVGEHELQVSVTPDKPQYGVRQTARARVKVTQGGKPVAGAEVAFAAVDEGLLALRPNTTWDLLRAMMQPRSWGVETSTGQSEIIGRRHHGRKAVAAGGGGGKNPTRELFDTLLLWKASVALDANGEAVIDVPLNDALTSFRLVAVADAGTQQFGTGSASIRVTQDLQMLSGLPPLVRDADTFNAMLTLRNTTGREMKVRAALQGTANKNGPAGDIVREPLTLSPQEVTLPAGGAQELQWTVQVPADAFSLTWEASADELAGEKTKDRVKVTQLVSPAVPVRVLQATLQQLDGTQSLPVAPPADALSALGVKRGGVNVGVQPTLAGALPGIRRYFETYPFICLEQKTSKAIGLKDPKLWATVVSQLPTYLDRDGLANYFPPRVEDEARGSDRLTAFLIAAAHEAGLELPAPQRDAMLKGLAAFAEGRIERKFWSPKADLDVRKLAAIEALSRHGRADARMLGSVNVTPNLWPTAAVIDWLNILRRVKNVPNQAQRLEEAQQILRSRLTYAGTTLRFSNEEDDFWWWLMDSADANAARLMLAVMDDPAWKDDLPRMVVGSLARQRGGAWLTTTANLWGSVALEKFAKRFESAQVAGQTTAALGDKTLSVDWARQPDGGTLKLAWPEKAPGTLTVSQQGTGKPWLTVQTLAAIPLKAPLRAGYTVTRTVTPVEQKVKGVWSRGDVMRVTLQVDANSDMTWVVVADPVPGGGTLLGSGLGRDSEIAATAAPTGRSDERAWPVFEERSFEAFRSYYEYLPRGRHTVEYTVRLNNPGRFALPPSRVEAMYSPETFGEVPNEVLEVKP